MAAENGNGELLSSWKEIAAYLNCDERTCSRWEKTLGLPVHRFEGAQKSRVFAYRRELETWRKGKENGHSLDRRGSRRTIFWKTAFLGLALFLAGTALFFGYRKAARPREPVNFRIEGSSLIVLNDRNDELWRFPTTVDGLVGEKDYREHFQIKRDVVSGIDFPWLIIGDITGDGRAEVLFAPRTVDEYREGLLFCFDRRGRELWRFRFGRPIRFGPQEYADFTIRGFVADDLDGDGRKEVIVNSNARGFYPDQLAVLGSDGKLRGEYWNSGQLLDIACIDLERDGRKEILVSGQNNEYRKPCLVVFDADRVSGCSPQSDDRFISPGLPAGTQRAYVLFPRTDVSLSNLPAETAGGIEVLSNDFIIVTMNSSRMIFELDFGLVCRLARTSHPFEQLHKVARREGRVSSVLGEAYFDALKRGVLYWSGTEWRLRPASPAL
jgi:hypothetical protein